MEQNEIIEMARQAGIIAIHTEGDGNWHQQFVALERFAKLVAAKERERVTFEVVNEAQRAVQEAVAKEREACAKVCEKLGYTKHGGWTCAEEIRARGQK